MKNPTRLSGVRELDNKRRRELLKGGIGAMTLVWSGLPFALLSRELYAAKAVEKPYTLARFSGFTFTNTGIGTHDGLGISKEYTAEVFFAWGEPLREEPLWKNDASNTAAEQAQQAGMHHSGIQYFPFTTEGALGMSAPSSAHGLLAVNHETTDEGLLHPDGMRTWTTEKIRKSQAAHGVSLVEIGRLKYQWLIRRDSEYSRRYDVNSPMLFSGPAAGASLLKTTASPDGVQTAGTLANSAAARTPWETFLSGEASFNGYFACSSGTLGAGEKRYGIDEKGAGFRWHEFDDRFDLAKEAHGANHFGWIVEIDPRDIAQKPVKRTALGRLKHGHMAMTLSKDKKVVVYLTDNDQFECLYKYVSQDGYTPLFASQGKKQTFLDKGTLYVARLERDGSGVWLPLIHGQNGLTAEAGFADQAEVLIRARQAADVLGATKIELPVKGIAVNPVPHTVCCSLGNADGEPFGRIIRWDEADNDPAALTFTWSILVEAGYKLAEENKARGTFRGDVFASPSILAFDDRTVCWLGTDADAMSLASENYTKVGHNQLLAMNPLSGETRRFLTLPKGASVRGITFTPDLTTMFVSVQHPGQGSQLFSDPDKPKAGSIWPDGESGGRPRSAVIAVRRTVGGYLGL